MVEEARLELLAAMSVFLTPAKVPDPRRVIDLVMCLSLFDEPSRAGKLAELRRESKATSLRELIDYMRTWHASAGEVCELSADIKRRMATIDADIARL